MVLEVGGEKLRRAKARADRAAEALDAAVRAVNKVTADAKAAKKAVETATAAGVKATAEEKAADEKEAKVKVCSSVCLCEFVFCYSCSHKTTMQP